jgi:hypothetical protein
MPTVKEIMQIGVGMPDRETFAQFSHDMLGFPTTNAPDGTVTYMRVDRYRHRLAARKAPVPVLNYIGFDVGGPEALAEWKTALAAKDLVWRPGSPRNVSNARWLTLSSSRIPTVIRWRYRMASRSTKSP